MTATKSLSSNPKPVLADPKKKPLGEKVVDWGILFKKDTTDNEKILKKLLASVREHQFDDNLQTASLQYQWLKSKDVKQLYTLLVFRQTGEPIETKGSRHGSFLESADDEGPSRTSGPQPPKPPLAVLEIFVREVSNQTNDSTGFTLESLNEVPSRTSGPQPPKPPTVR